MWLSPLASSPLPRSLPPYDKPEPLAPEAARPPVGGGPPGRRSSSARPDGRGSAPDRIDSPHPLRALGHELDHRDLALCVVALAQTPLAGMAQLARETGEIVLERESREHPPRGELAAHRGPAAQAEDLRSRP